MHFLTVQLIHVFLVPMHLDLDLGMRLLYLCFAGALRQIFL